MRFNVMNLNKAIQQTIVAKVMFTTDEKIGAAWLNAIAKAEHNLRENYSIYFADGTLVFKSLDSKLTRIVTASGCVESFCECKNQISYHKALHAILTRYFQLESEPLVEGERFTESIGGIETRFVVENGKKVKTAEYCAGIRVWARGKTQPVTPPPVLADVLQFQPKTEASNKNLKAVA